MRIKQIFDILQSTELKQIASGKDEDRVLTFLNLALIEVYGKFNILQEEQVITIVAGQTRYILQDNSQRIVQVFYRNLEKHPLLGDDGYREVPLNDTECDESVFTPQPYVLHIPNPDAGREYSVIQTVTPPYITKENINTVDFIVPPQYLEPILHYAAYRAYKAMNGDEKTEIGSHYKFYILSCDEVYRKGLVQYNMMTNVKGTDRGFPTSRGGDHGQYTK